MKSNLVEFGRIYSNASWGGQARFVAGQGWPIGGAFNDLAHALEPEGGARVTSPRPFERGGRALGRES